MNRQDLIDHLIQSLEPQFGRGEASSIARIVREDLFPGPLLADLTLDEVTQFNTVLQQLQEGIPVQYVVGSTIFYGYRFRVTDQVLIPRPETEELVYTAINICKNKRSKPLRIIDIGTGSGCIAVTVQKELATSTVWAVDRSASALEVATQNAIALGASVEFQEMNFLQPKEWRSLPGNLDLILSNPPYIPPSERNQMPDSVWQHEPAVALFVEEDDPLIFYREIKEFSAVHLAPDGHLVLEMNEFHSQEIGDLYKTSFQDVEIIKDLQGKDRILVASRRFA